MPHHPAEAAHADSEKTASAADEKLLDDALKETFPASDPISPSSTAKQAPPQPVLAPAAPAPRPSDAPFPFPTAQSVASGQPDPPKPGT